MNQRRRAPRDRRYSVSLAVLVFVFAASFLQAQSEFIRGDANQDGRVSISDMVTNQRYQFVDGIELGCMDTLDFDDNGVLDITDGIEMLHRLFIDDDWGGPVPAPFPNPGIDPTPDVAIHLWSEITCESYEIVEGIVSKDTIRLGEVEARPGETVEVPIYLTNSIPVQATQLLIEYDSSVLQIDSGADTLTYEGSFYEKFFGKRYTWSNGNSSSSFNYPDDRAGFSYVVAHSELGVASVGILGMLIFDGFEITPGEEKLIANLRVHVLPTATPGSIIPLALSNGPGGDGHGPFRMRNEITFKGETRYATLFPQTIPGQLNIIQDITFFTRGNANGDSEVDVSDAVFVLAFLFLGQDAPRCADAADADDNGELELTDAIVILDHLFIGTATIAAPYPRPGYDLTDDDLPCEEGSRP